MTIYLITIALINLALGYGLAVVLGHSLHGDFGRRWWQSSSVAADTWAPITPIGISQAIMAPEEEPTLPNEQTTESLSEFSAQLERFYQQLADVDVTVRDCAEMPQAATAIQCRDALQSASREYLDNQSATLERLRTAEADGGEDPLATWFSGAVVDQTDQVRTINTQINKIDLANNIADGCQQLLQQMDLLDSSSSGLRDALEHAKQELERRGQQPEAQGDRPTDALCTMASRASIERALTEWWRQDPGHTRPLTLGLLEIDQFVAIHDNFGSRTADAVMQALASITAGITRGDDLAARSSNQRIMIMFPDTAASSSTSAIERVRQLVEASQFCREGDPVRVTVTGAVVEATANDDAASVMARVEATLGEAKRYGGNRTFLHEGKFPAPVVPPRFVLESKSWPI